MAITQNNKLDINGILLQYHQKFDDSKVRELLGELEQMIYERADFFSEINDHKDDKFREKLDEYWHDLDHLGYGSSEELSLSYGLIPMLLICIPMWMISFKKPDELDQIEYLNSQKGKHKIYKGIESEEKISC